jgi:hypothetical protein
MARNRSRRNQSGTMWLLPALKAGVLCTMLGGSAIGYVLQKNQLIELGRTITRREAELERLKWENKLHSQRLANSQLPQNIALRVREHKLGLMPPQPGQTIWLMEPEGSKSVIILNTDSKPGNTQSRTNQLRPRE